MSRNKPVPCPFCGKDPVVRRGQGYEYGMHRVVCMSADCTIPKTEYTGPAGESKAIKAWNKQWADGVICNLSEQNIALSKDCQRLMRANEKYRRKLAKRRAQQLRRQYNPENLSREWSQRSASATAYQRAKLFGLSVGKEPNTLLAMIHVMSERGMFNDMHRLGIRRLDAIQRHILERATITEVFSPEGKPLWAVQNGSGKVGAK